MAKVLSLNSSGDLEEVEVTSGSGDGRISNRITSALSLLAYEQYIVHEELLIEADISLADTAQVVVL